MVALSEAPAFPPFYIGGAPAMNEVFAREAFRTSRLADFASRKELVADFVEKLGIVPVRCC